MRVRDAIRYLSEYEDQDQEIMIGWNDNDHLEVSDPEIWERAVLCFEKYFEGFNDECREAISIAQAQIEEGKK